jgi:Fe-S cluster assembly protein SufD
MMNTKETILIAKDTEQTLTGAALQHSETRFILKEQSRLTLLLQCDGEYEKTYCVDLQRDSHCRIIFLAKISDKLVANQKINITFAAENSFFEYYAFCDAAAGAQVAVSVDVRHEAASCRSRQLFKAVAADEARVNFHSRVLVARGAQHTDAVQTSKAIILSRTAYVAAQPQLEIYADDVKCAHGATVGQLDEAALFYLTSRGIDRAQAREMLLESFAEEVVAMVPEEIRE